MTRIATTLQRIPRDAVIWMPISTKDPGGNVREKLYVRAHRVNQYFAVHRRILSDGRGFDRDRYIVAHIPTGYAATRPTDRKSAMAIARAFPRVTQSWNFADPEKARHLARRHPVIRELYSAAMKGDVTDAMVDAIVSKGKGPRMGTGSNSRGNGNGRHAARPGKAGGVRETVATIRTKDAWVADRLAKAIASATKGEIAAALEPLAVHHIATIIDADWRRPYFGAVPYIDAMRTMVNVDDYFGADPGDHIARYFLSNATMWRGPIARIIKGELNRRLGR